MRSTHIGVERRAIRGKEGMGDISLIMILVEGSAFVIKNECCVPRSHPPESTR
jgi:hypothetical protein